MESIILANVFGLILGILAGLLPGIGTGSLLGLCYLILVRADPITVLLFYIGVLTAAQYFGSVAAIMTGVPGDASAIPASTYGFRASQHGAGPELLYNTSKYSLYGGLISFVIFLVLIAINWHWARSMGAIFQGCLILAAFMAIVVLSPNKYYTNILLAIAGIMSGMVGFSANYQMYLLTTPTSLFNNGIPWLALLSGILVIPGLLSIKPIGAMSNIGNNTSTNKSYGIVASRGGVIGFILGMVPGLSYVLSSIIAAKVEERISGSDYRIVIASETANNAGAVSTLLPFLLLGIPITASESIIFNILTNNVSISKMSDLVSNNWYTFIISFVISNIILFVLAWRMAVPLCRLLFNNIRIIQVIGIVLTLSGLIYEGYENYHLLASIITFIVSAIIGIISLKRYDIEWSPLIYAFLLYDYMESTVYKVYQLYF